MDLNRTLSRWFYVICIGTVFAVNAVFAGGGLGGHWHLDVITPEQQHVEHESQRNQGREASDRVMQYHQLPAHEQKNTPPPSRKEYQDAFKFFEDNLSYMREMLYYLQICLNQCMI